MRSDRREARLSVEGGTPRAIALYPADDETLGDTLDRMGRLDHRNHRRALLRGPPIGPVGDWLVACGAATADAVTHALRIQLQRRVVLVMSWPIAEFRFRGGRTDVGVAPVKEPIGAADLVLSAMRAVVEEEPLVKARRRLGDGIVLLSRLGRALVNEAESLTPEERLMLPLLETGATVDTVLATAGSSGAAIRALYALRLLSAIGPPSAGKHYGVLLRKHRQLRRAARARELLDLPQEADSSEARRALRRLASAVHPDRFDGAEDPAVRRVSSEVMAALVKAEANVRGG